MKEKVGCMEVKPMKITQKIIDDLENALDMRKKNGDPVWDDGDEISVNVGGTFAADKFISLINKTKNPVVSSQPLKPGEKNDMEVKSFNGISVPLLSGALGEGYRKDWTEDQLKEYEEYLKGDQ